MSPEGPQGARTSSFLFHAGDGAVQSRRLKHTLFRRSARPSRWCLSDLSLCLASRDFSGARRATERTLRLLEAPPGQSSCHLSLLHMTHSSIARYLKSYHSFQTVDLRFTLSLVGTASQKAQILYLMWISPAKMNGECQRRCGVWLLGMLLRMSVCINLRASKSWQGRPVGEASASILIGCCSHAFRYPAQHSLHHC